MVNSSWIDASDEMIKVSRLHGFECERRYFDWDCGLDYWKNNNGFNYCRNFPNGKCKKFTLFQKYSLGKDTS